MILNTRPQNQSLGTSNQFQKAGYEVVQAPLLEVEYMPIHFSLTPDFIYIVTSSNAFWALKDHPSARDYEYLTLSLFSKEVGNSLGFKNIHFFEGVLNAEDLARHILTVNSQIQREYVYLRGEDVTLDLVELLKSQGYKSHSVIVYKSRFVESWPSSVIDLFNQGKIQAITFYSQKTASSFLSLAEKYNLQKFLGGVSALCLSEKIERCLKVLPWQGIITASTTTAIIAKFK